ncbi:MAG: hypothetical protein NT128_08275, partial [Proteobacteria bacterium]|nr:hypothetical protein [Pseudomonadota bacterium]
NDKTAIEGFTKNLRNAELDAYCNRNGIETSKGALISQTLRDLVLLTNALIQNTTISASKHIIASDSTKEFSPFVTRF